MLNAVPFGTEFVETAPADAAAFTLFTRADNGLFLLETTAKETSSYMTLPAALERLEQDLLLHVGIHAPDRIFLHAGVVGWRGRAILFPGFSRAGKTTLVAELVKLGATYYSDDYALLDAGGLVHPYARDLQMRQPGRLRQERLTLDELGGRAGIEPIPVGQIVFTEFVSGAKWTPEPLTPGLAVLEMLRHTIPARRRPTPVLVTLGRVMRSASACRSRRGEASILAKSLLNALEGGPR